MRFKVICNELFQSVESIVECETFEELRDYIHNVTSAIYDGSSEIAEKTKKDVPSNMPRKAKIRPVEPRSDGGGHITPKQEELIRKKANSAIIEDINFDTMTKQEASDLIKALFDQDN